MGAMSGGSLPTLRGIPKDIPEEKFSCNFFFQVIHPEAFDAGNFAGNRNQGDNLQAVLDDVLKEGNENCLLPGQMEAQFAKKSEINQGLLFSNKELEEFANLAQDTDVAFDPEQFPAAS